MTHPTREDEERLRRALRAAADSVEPSADGLERIRARLTPARPLVAAWMASDADPAGRRLRSALAAGRIRTGRIRTGRALGPVRPALAGIGSARDKFRAGPPWLRLVASMAVFLVIVGSGAFAISSLQPAATSVAGGPASSGHGRSSSPSGGGAAQAGSAHELKDTNWPVVPAPLNELGPLLPATLPSPQSPSPQASCSPTPTPTPSPTPTSTPTPTPSPTVTPTPTVTPSPSTSPSTSPSPAASTVPTGDAADAGVSESMGNGVPLSGAGTSPSPAGISPSPSGIGPSPSGGSPSPSATSPSPSPGSPSPGPAKTNC
jgi:hypothetical protein